MKGESIMFKDNQQPSIQPPFGSIGDSVSLDDYQTTTGPITGSTVTPNFIFLENKEEHYYDYQY